MIFLYKKKILFFFLTYEIFFFLIIMTSLHSASKNGDLKSVKELVNRGINIDSQTSDRWTALHRAVFYEHEDIVRFLIDNGANCNIFNNKKRTPLHLAAAKGNLLILILLIEGFAEINPKDKIKFIFF